MKKIIVLGTALILCSLFGCQKQQQKISVSEITGQPDIELSAVAQFLRKDGSRYLTQQQLEIYSAPRAIIFTANEPYGKVVWSVQNGEYAIKGRTRKPFDIDIVKTMTDKDIAQGLLELYLAGLGNIQPKDSKETLNFDGQIYEFAAQSEPNVNLYRNKSTGKLDLVTSGQNNGGKVYFIHGYNYRKMRKTAGQDIFYASKVDIYLYRAGFEKELIAQISSSLKQNNAR